MRRANIYAGKYPAAATLGAILVAIAGCSCVEADFRQSGMTNPAAVTVQDHAGCRYERLAKRSAEAAEIEATADPALLNRARTEAERNCLRERS